MAGKSGKRRRNESSKTKTIKKVVKKLKDAVSAGELSAVVGGLQLFYDQDERFLKQCRDERVGRLMGDESPTQDGLPYGDGLPVGDGVPVMEGPSGAARRRRR